MDFARVRRVASRTWSAGPILRASQLLPQIAQPRADHAGTDAGRRLARRRGASSEGVRRRQPGGASPTRSSTRRTHHTGINVLLGVYAFAFQIYGDFAGYSNIARGISKLMGIELLENFRFPYFVRIAAGVLAPLAHQPVDVARATTSTFRSAATAVGVADATATCSSRWCSAGCGTARPGRSCLWGLYPRFAADRISLGAGRLQPCSGGCSAPSPVARVARLGPDVPLHVLRLADFPGAFWRQLRGPDWQPGAASSRPFDRRRPRDRSCRSSSTRRRSLLVHACEAYFDDDAGRSGGCRSACDTLSTPRRSISRCSSATSGGSDFIYFQF